MSPPHRGIMNHVFLVVITLNFAVSRSTFFPPNFPLSEWFYIRSRLNGFVLEETGKEKPLVVNPESGRNGQLWKWQGTSIISKNNIAIDIGGPINNDWNNGGKIVGWPPHKGNNQIWKFEKDRIVALGRTNFALEIEASKPIAGAKVIASKIKRKQEQRWSLSYIDKASHSTAFDKEHLPDSPIVITDNNRRQLNKGEWLIEFYAPWCPACRAMQPRWNQLARDVKAFGDVRVRIAKCDVTHNPRLRSRMKIAKVPSFFHVQKKKYRKYSGSKVLKLRSSEELYDYLMKKKRPVVEKWREPQITKDPNFVKGEGCGTRFFEQDNAISRIVGGKDAAQGSLPWSVTIQNSWRHDCGGTIIGKRWILTAAHCFPPGGKNEKVVVGEHNLRHNDGNEQSFRISRVYPHPHYNPRNFDNDICLLKLSKDLRFDRYTQPACLPKRANKERDYRTGDIVTVSGWGRLREWGHAPNTLQMIRVPLISTQTCNNWNVYSGKILTSMFCAGKLSGSIDSCSGDSGGPLMKKVDGRWTVLGVVSWGNGCAKVNKPGVYASVVNFEKWIKETMSKN